MSANTATTPASNSADTGPATDDEPMVVWSITRAQRKFLALKLPEYRTAFGNNILPQFFTALYNEWFGRWPNSDDTTRPFVEEQLRSWLLSNSRWLPSSAQKRFLKDSIPDYKASQESKTLVDFWARFFAEWFSRWAPTEIAPQAVVERKLKAWFNNNARVTANARQVLNLNKPAKRTRRPAPYQTFCNVYWNIPVVEGATVAQVVKREWVIEWKNSENYKADTLRPAPPVTFVNAVAARIYGSVSDAIKKEISEHPDQQKDQPKRDRDDEEEGDERVRQAREFQKAIDSLPYSLDQAGKQILEKTGLVMFTMVAGPVPAQGGNIVVYSKVEGQTPTGCNFIQYCPSFGTDIEARFVDFAKLVFPPTERLKRALPGKEHLRNYDVPILQTTPGPQASTVVQAAPSPRPVLPEGLLQLDEPSSDSEADGLSEREPTRRPVSRLSEYEKERLANIERNKQLLEDLGLNDVQFGGRPKAVRAVRKRKDLEAAVTRRSSRLAGEQDGEGAADTEPKTAAAVMASATDASATDPAPSSVIVTATAAEATQPASPSSEGAAIVPNPIIVTATPAPVVAAALADGATVLASSTEGASTPSLASSPIPMAVDDIPTIEGAAVVPSSTTNPAIAMEVDDVPMPCLSDAPEWLRDAVEHLKTLSKDERWGSVVAQFVKFERSLGFLDGRISTHMLAAGKQRPKEVSAWVKSGRAVDPNIKNFKAFSQQWWLWYHELQPESRKSVEGCLQRITPSNDEWTELRKGTVNGIYSLLASLGWWMKAAKASGECQDDVSLALSDISWTLQSMVQVGTSKRASPESEDRVSKRARAA